MSIRVMTAVWDRFDGPERLLLLALALADWANDQGGDIYPSIDSLAHKIRRDRRTAQRQLRELEDIGWLMRVARRPGQYGTNAYCISPAWLSGGPVQGRQDAAAETRHDAAPDESTGGSAPPLRDELRGGTSAARGRHRCRSGAAPVSFRGGTSAAQSVMNRQEPSGEPSRADARGGGEPSRVLPAGLDENTWARWVEYRSALRAPFLEVTQAEQASWLAQFAPAQQALVVATSIRQGYIGLVAPTAAGTADEPITAADWLPAEGERGTG